ncbi:MAG: tetratricopeptide repeat protein [Gammaproteobacteria bacterium]|nr:tetratricopeptide repeat protein [Gammaproteobacteria bacterium]MCP5136775.1 tetratricopeptide repeat protein [Gammaproteobacteria bacterium]
MNDSHVDALLRQGVGLLQQGNLARAEALFVEVLRRSPRQADALNLLGVIKHQGGFSTEALKLVRQALTLQPRTAPYHRNLGLIQLAMGQVSSAVTSFRNTLQLAPHDAATHNDLGVAYGRLGRFAEELREYDLAIAEAGDFADAYSNRGRALAGKGDLERALDDLDTAIRLRPNHGDALVNQTMVLLELGRLEEALRAISRAIEVMPTAPTVHNTHGVVLQALGDLDGAIASYRRAIELDPGFVDAHANLCECLERGNRMDDLRAALATAMQGALRSDPRLRFYQAKLANREARYKDACGILEKINLKSLPPKLQAPCSTLLAKVYDRVGQYPKAFKQFQHTNRQIELGAPAVTGMAQGYYDRVALLDRAWSAVAAPLSWPDAKPRSRTPQLVFLVGFPRSGTTLLDTILRSHPAICVIEEKPLLDTIRVAWNKAGTPENLSALSADACAAMAQGYMNQLAASDEFDANAAVVVDKYPLNLVDAGLIHRLFPDARFLFALRHPYDVTLSCFMQNFALNGAMANFLSMSGTARLYDRVMHLWSAYRAALPLSVHTLKYEDLIQDLRATCEPVLDFVGLQWDERLHDYQRTAFDRTIINTPSYNQVTQPLYTSARGRWRNYRRMMSEADPYLAPWVERFAYPDSEG